MAASSRFQYRVRGHLSSIPLPSYHILKGPFPHITEIFGTRLHGTGFLRKTPLRGSERFLEQRFVTPVPWKWPAPGLRALDGFYDALGQAGQALDLRGDDNFGGLSVGSGLKASKALILMTLSVGADSLRSFKEFCHGLVHPENSSSFGFGLHDTGPAFRRRPGGS